MFLVQLIRAEDFLAAQPSGGGDSGFSMDSEWVYCSNQENVPLLGGDTGVGSSPQFLNPFLRPFILPLSWSFAIVVRGDFPTPHIPSTADLRYPEANAESLLATSRGTLTQSMHSLIIDVDA